jgi:hypothetical protein
MSGTEEQDDKMDRSTDNVDQRAAGAEDVELDEAIKSFKQSVDAWSDAAYGRPRTVEQTVRRRSWRLAVGWALGCVLVAGSVSGGLFERQHQIELKQRANRERAAEQQKQVQQQQARAQVTDEDLLSDVDSDVSRQVPSAMEPLAQMMSVDETK